MTRITINKMFVAVIAAMLLLGGCSKEYSLDRLEADGPEAKRVKSLIADLRQAGTDGLDDTLTAQAIPELTTKQLEALRAALEKMIFADSVELEKIEQFGENVYRAVLAMETEGKPESMAMLLSPGPDDKLRWIGKN